MSIRNAAVITLFCAVAAYSGLSLEQKKDAAQGQQTSRFSLQTNLVLVPVIVTTKNGEHVTGLTKEDFEVKEDGKDQTIVRLDEVTAEPEKVKAEAPGANRFSNQLVAEHPKKLVIIALDEINTPFAGRAETRRGVMGFLSRNVDANTLLALISLQPNGIHLIHNFTSDPRVMVAAVRKVESTLSPRDIRAQDIPGENTEIDAEALQLQALLTGADFSTATSANQLAAAARAASAQNRAQVDASQESQSALLTLECLQQVAYYFGAVPGRKSFIWATAAFPFSLGSGARELTRGTVYDDWQRTFHALQDANIAVYPVDVSGLVTGSAGANTLQNIDSTQISNNSGAGIAARTQQLDAASSGAFLNPSEARHETMRYLSDMTGGEAFYNSNNGAELFRRAGDDSAQYYVLAYYAGSTGRQGWRKLSVKVRRNGTKVRARSGYFFRSPGADSDAERIAKETIALDSDLNFSTLPLTGVWQQIEPNGKQRSVHFLLTVPAGVTSIDTDEKNRISMDFRVLVKNAAGQIAATIGQRLDTNLDQMGVDQVQNHGLDYTNVLNLDPGEYKVHFVVRDNLRGSLGSVVVPLKVE